MFEAAPRADALVLYKTHPARVRAVADKIEIELEGGQTKRVRPKDLLLLHPGPLHRLSDLVRALGQPHRCLGAAGGGRHQFGRAGGAGV